MDIGRRVYFNTSNGSVIIDCGEKTGDVTPTPVEDDLIYYPILSLLDSNTFDYVDFPYSAYDAEFMNYRGFIIDLTNKTPIFY